MSRGAWTGLLCAALMLCACGGSPKRADPVTATTPDAEQDRGPDRAVDVSQIPEPVPRAEPRSRYGNQASYKVLGKTYRVQESSQGYVERGVASWYGVKFHGRPTSSFEPYDMYKFTAAHKTLPLPTFARVTNLENGRSVVLRINDRGPFHDNRLIDLSYAAAVRLGIHARGTGLVEVRVIDPQSAASVPPVAVTQNQDALPQAGLESTGAVIAATESPRIYLQVGAYADRQNADQTVARLSAADIGPLTVQAAQKDQLPVHRVRIGPLVDVESADRIARRVKALGLGLPRIAID